ncbi:MAG: hypothetical protein WD055_02965 [Candidatus Dependentiae bacterium]
MIYLLLTTLFCCTINTADIQIRNLPKGMPIDAVADKETAGFFATYDNGDTILIQQIKKDLFRVGVTHNGTNYAWYTDKKDLWKTIETKFRGLPMEEPLTKKDIALIWHGMARDVRYMQDPSFRKIINEWKVIAAQEPVTKGIWKKNVELATHSPEWKKFRRSLTHSQMLRILNVYNA